MADQPSIFVSYSHADTRWLNELDPHLKGLSLHAKVERFDDRQLFGGDDWNAEVKAALDRADIILLLVTANFIGSEYIHRVELPAALKRRQEHGSVVVPVLVQDCARKLLAIDDINYLPKDPSGALKPLARWRGAERDSGFRQVTEHVLLQIERYRRRAEQEVGTAAVSLGRRKLPPSASDLRVRATEETASNAARAGDRLPARHPAGFLSYVRLDDQHENGRITEFKNWLSGEVRIQAAREFDIFHDQNDIAWGEPWQRRINDSLDAVSFLIPILTPRFFESSQCRSELQRFLEREKKLGRDDLILPIYYLNCSTLNDENKRAADPLATLIASRQYADWRELRFEPFNSPQVGSNFARLAERIVRSIRSTHPQKRVSGGPPGDAVPSARDATETAPNREEEVVQITEFAQRPADKAEPPTRVVDALYRGDHATLVDALHSAHPDDRILIRPGMYRENIIIDKPVEIVGDGKIDDVIIETTEGTTVVFQTNMARIANLTLRQAGNGNYHCIDIAQGRLDLEECDITSQSQGRACVAIHDGADPRLRRNRIHDGKEGGVFVYANGKGTLEDNDIFANAAAGVAIMTGGNPILRRNRIHDGEQSGVYLFGNGRGTLEDNEIFANTLAGVAITEGGNPTLRRNQIHDGNEIGVYVAANGRGTLEENDIFRNARAGVEIKTGGNPTLHRNRIYDGKQSGIYVYENGKGTLEENDIFANAGAGVEIREGGNPTLRRNRIHGGRRAGVLVRTNGRGSVEDNEIFANEGAGVEIRHNGNPTLRRNRIHDGNGAGVFVYDNGRGTLEENEIFANSGPGIETREGGNPTLRRNRIHAGRGAGVLVRTNGQGSIEDNDILANASSGLEIRPGGKPSVRRNRISRNALHAILVYDGGQGIFEDNDLRGNGAGAWDVSTDCQDKVMRKHNQE